MQAFTALTVILIVLIACCFLLGNLLAIAVA